MFEPSHRYSWNRVRTLLRQGDDALQHQPARPPLSADLCDVVGMPERAATAKLLIALHEIKRLHAETSKRGYLWP